MSWASAGRLSSRNIQKLVHTSGSCCWLSAVYIDVGRSVHIQASLQHGSWVPEQESPEREPGGDHIALCDLASVLLLPSFKAKEHRPNLSLLHHEKSMWDGMYFNTVIFRKYYLPQHVTSFKYLISEYSS